MLYLSGVLPPDRTPFLSGEFGLMATPASGYDLGRLPGVTWAADNGCFSGTWNEAKWWAWLQRWAHLADTCLFAVAPDVVGDHATTVERSAPWLPLIAELGYQRAFVAQDGWDETTAPWDDFEALFIGGSTEFKEGAAAEAAAAAAIARGKTVHMGRVNSGRRVAIARRFGCASCDGTFLAFGPDKNIIRLRSFLSRSVYIERTGMRRR